MKISSIKKMKVIHLVPGLAKGGAETMVYNILKNKTDETIEYIVISLGLSTYFEELIRDLGVDVKEFNIIKHPIKTVLSIRKTIEREDVLCCWLYFGCIVGLLCGWKRTKKLIWCIRHANLEKKLNSISTIVFGRLCAVFSKKADIITYNGNTARLFHEAIGYSKNKSRILINGCDIDFYYYDFEKRCRIRNEIGISDNQKVLISVCRNDVIKDIPCFIRAFSIIKREYVDTIAVMCGRGIEPDDPFLNKLCDEVGLKIGDDILFLGFRPDVEALLCAADLYILHSASEAFPNTLLQAMACELPCVSTDVGDAAEIIGDAEYIVPIGDYEALSQKINTLLSMNEAERRVIGKKNRGIVERRNNIKDVVRLYERCYTGMVYDRILYIGQFELPDKNAAAHRVLGVAKGIRECGGEVVFCGISKLYAASQKQGTVQGFESYSRLYPRSLAEWVHYVLFLNDYIQLINQYNINAVVLYNTPSILGLRIKGYCRCAGIACIADVTEWYQPNKKNWYLYIAKSIDEWFRMHIINKKMSGLIVISTYLQEYYKRERNVVRIPPTVDIASSIWNNTPKKNEDFIRIVFPSDAIVRDKADTIVEAVSKVKRRVLLDIVGVTKKQYLDEFPKHDRIIHENEDIVFHGRVSHEQTIRLIDMADCVCFFRENNRTSAAGFPTKLVEAKTVGVSVMTNATGDVMLYADDTDIIIENVNDVDKLAEKIETITHRIPNGLSDVFDYHRYMHATWKVLGGV